MGAVAAVIFGGVALAPVAVAAQVTPPVLSNSAGSEEQAVVLAPEVLDRYVGFYLRGENIVYRVTRERRDGAQLFIQLLSFEPMELFAVSETDFSPKKGGGRLRLCAMDRDRP